MATAAPSSPPHDLLRLTIATAKAWALALTSYVGSLAALVGGYFGLKAAFPAWHDGLIVGVAAIPLVLALLTITLPAWLRRWRDRKLVEEGISGTLNDPEYFRIWPYEASDSERYSRPDGAHEEVLRWLRVATARSSTSPAAPAPARAPCSTPGSCRSSRRVIRPTRRWSCGAIATRWPSW